MEITWLGRTCFRLKGREGVVLTDPCPPESGYKIAKTAANVITLSRKDDPGYSATSIASGDPMVFDAPGEYEVGGILVTAVATKTASGERNVAFIVELDGVRIGHLGLLGQQPDSRAMEFLKNVDVLLLPAGGGNALAARTAQDLMTSIDPSVAIPMNYKTEQETLDLEPLASFLKETGAKPEPLPRFQSTKNGLPQELSVVVLEPRNG